MRFRLWPLLASMLLMDCASLPKRPAVAVLPGAGKTFEQFHEDDAVCRHYARYQVRAIAKQGATGSVARDAIQGRYDLSYVQCMSVRGNRVPPPPGTSSSPLPPVP
jgi:hypothetical protein